MKLIIDCDPGIDDVYAITAACLNEFVEILAITVVNGNTSVDNGVLNTKLFLDKIYPRKNQPPIYIGAANPLIANPNVHYYFEKDGLANTHETLFKADVDNLKETFLKGKKKNNEPHAANVLIELVNKYPNEITIIALGPLTNLALAIKLSHDPIEFTRKIKKLVIMGGNEPQGFSCEPTIGPTRNYPEFNFRVDPVAAKAVIDEYLCPITIYTFDCCLRTFRIKTALLVEEFDKYIQKSKRCSFLERIGIIHSKLTTFPDLFSSCDLVAMLGELYGKECNAVYKTLMNHTIEIKNGELDGLLIERTVNNETAPNNNNVELCIKMDSVLTYDIFKLKLKQLEELDHLASNN